VKELHGIQILHVGVHGADHDRISSYTFTTKVVDTAVSNQPKEEDIMQDSAQCENCGAWVPERTMPLHERFCLRNNIRCPWGCGVVFKKDSEQLRNHWHCDKCDTQGTISEKEKHETYFHQEKVCACGFKTPSLTILARHRKTECPMKLIICRYCRVSIIYSCLIDLNLSHHFAFRTLYHKSTPRKLHKTYYWVCMAMRATVDQELSSAKNVINRYP
jgi:hypothetical protein